MLRFLLGMTVLDLCCGDLTFDLYFNPLPKQFKSQLLGLKLNRNSPTHAKFKHTFMKDNAKMYRVFILTAFTSSQFKALNGLKKRV